MLNLFHNFSPSPVLIDLGIIKIHWYGLLIAVAVFFCLRLAAQLFPKTALARNHVFNLGFYLVVFGLLGARLWHALFYNFEYFYSRPLALLQVWQGGLAIHGAILAGLITAIVYCRRQQLLFWPVAGVLAIVLPLGQAIGRWGNYFNQELFGRPCDYLWCLPIDPINRPVQYADFQYFHPVFLYESLLDLILFLVLIWLYQRLKTSSGLLVLFYLGGYALIRLITEFWRLDSAELGYFTWVQWLCLAVILSVSLGLAKRKKILYT